jgi:predicted nicotinamide N-methyase
VLTNRSVHGREYTLYRVPDLDRLVDEIDPETWTHDEKMPYWAELWPSGIALATLLAEETLPLRNVRVLELGCGLGLPSIVAAQLGAHVTATDYYPEALDLLGINAALNGVSVRTREVDWRTPPDLGRFDVVMAADVLYERWQTACMVDMLARTLLPTGRAILIDPDRVTAREFSSAATFRGFLVEKQPYCVEGQSGPISAYNLRWRVASPSQGLEQKQ